MRGDKFAGFASAEAAGARKFSLQPKPIFVTIGSQDKMVPLAFQHRSFDIVLKVNQAGEPTTSFGPRGTLYTGKTPLSSGNTKAPTPSPATPTRR